VIQGEVHGESLTQRELIGFAFLLLVAGNETTTNLISNAAVQLDRHLDQRQQLLDNPALIPNAVEEFLRFDSPVQGLARLEARVAYEELLSRLPHYRLKDSRVERLCSGPIRGAVTLPISTGR